MPTELSSTIAGPPLAVLGEALEIILARGATDLSISPRRISAVIADLVDRLLHSQDAPEDTVTVAARLLAAPLAEITTDPNLRLYRARQLLPPHKVRQQDTQCLQWLARQPGRSVREKINGRNRLLAVTRNLGPAKLEHSFALLVCSRLEPLVRRYLDEFDQPGVVGNKGHQRLHLTRQLWTAITDYQQFAAQHSIPEPHNLPHPNNVLLHERRYRRVWLGARWLAEQNARAESVAQRAAYIWQELVAWFAAAALQRFGFTFVESGYMPIEPSVRSQGRQIAWLGLWFQSSGQAFRKVRIQLALKGDVIVWSLEKDAQACRSKCFRISTNRNAEADWAMPLDSALTEGWKGATSESELLLQALSEWLGITPVSPVEIPRVPALSDNGFFRVSARSLQFRCNGHIRSTPASAVGLNLDETAATRRPSFYLSGGDAAWVQMFRGSAATDFADELPLSGAVARSWIAPGHFFRSCYSSHPFRVEACRALLRALFPAEALRRLVAATPHRLSYAAITRFHDALPIPLERKWIIPQPVAIALAWRETHLQNVSENAWYGFLDLEAEFPDFALLQCKRLDTEDADFGWLRYPALSRNPAPTSRWLDQLAAAVLARQEIPVNGRQVGTLLAQLSECEVFQLAEGVKTAVYAWVRQGPTWRRVTVEKTDVAPVLKQWAQSVSDHIAREIEQRPQCAPVNMIVSGRLSAFEWVQSALKTLPVPVEFTNEDLALRGLAVFENRFLEGLPTYRDFIPDLRISIRGADGRSDWHPLFTGGESGREASVDRLLEGEDFAFSVPANTKFIRLPMESDHERAEVDPVIRLESPPVTDCPILVRAQYEAAGRGLVLSLRSETPGQIPHMELEWDNLGEESIDEEPPTLPVLPHLSLKLGELNVALNEFRQAFQQLGAMRDPQTAIALKKAAKGLSKLLQRHVTSSSPDEWTNVARSPSAEPLAELVARLAFLLGMNNKDSISPILQGDDSFKRPAGKVELSILRNDSELQIQIHQCLARFAAASPENFIRHCLALIDAPKTKPNIRQACIYSLGRTASTWAKPGPRREAAQRIFFQIATLTEGGSLSNPEKWQEFGWWTRALAFYLAGNPWQIANIPAVWLHGLGKTLADAIVNLSASACDDENVWSSILAALLFLRYAMRLPDQGVLEFGPKSEFARRIVAALEKAGRSSAVHGIARVNLRRFVQNPEVLRGETDFERVAGIWQGKAAGVLLQASVEDE